MIPYAIDRTRAARAIAATLTFLVALAGSLASGTASAARSTAATPGAKSATGTADSTGIGARDADLLFRAVVKIETRAVPNARSAATLGEEREGNGVVIGNNSLILTI